MVAYLMIGEVLKPQGIRGEAKVRSWAADAEMFFDWDTLYLRDGGAYTPIRLRCSRVQDEFAYVTFEGCTRPEDVEKLRGRELYVDRAHAAPLPEGSYYLADLIGCRVVAEDGAEIGTLTDVLQHGPTDTYVIRTASGTMMAPALKDTFIRTDVESGVITARPERLREIAVEDA